MIPGPPIRALPVISGLVTLRRAAYAQAKNQCQSSLLQLVFRQHAFFLFQADVCKRRNSMQRKQDGCSAPRRVKEEKKGKIVRE